MKLIALLIFIAVYALMLLLPTWRAAAALAAAAAFVLIGIVPVREVAGAVDWNVLLMLAGTMGTVDLFIRSNMPNRLSDRLVSVLPSVKWLIIALALFAGLVSAFVDNVATVLMLAPVGLAISKKLNISPVEPILAIAVSSNLQGAATLVGDTTSILLAGHMGLDFMDFFVYRGPPGMLSTKAEINTDAHTMMVYVQNRLPPPMREIARLSSSMMPTRSMPRITINSPASRPSVS